MPGSGRAARFTAPHLVEFRSGGAPVVLIPGVLGLSLAYSQIAQSLPEERAFYAFDLPGSMDDEPALPLSIDDIADVLEPQLLAACPRGPRVLGGFSMGTMVAFELARRLARVGKAPEQLLSLDGTAPRFTQRPIPVGARAEAHARALLRAPLRYASERRVNWTRRALAFFREEWRVVSRVPPEHRRTDRRLRRAIAFRHRAAVAYHPREKLPIPMIVVRPKTAELALGATDLDDYGWSDFVSGPISVHKVDGTHRTLLGSQEVASLLRDVLAIPSTREAKQA